MTSLLHTKKMFYDTYGEIPPMVAFLGIDTDGGWYNKSLEAKDGTQVKLMPNEQLPIYVKNDPQPIYRVQKSHLKWFPEKENLKFLKSMTLGAGQLRSNGRFAFTCNETDVYSRLKQVSDKVSNVQHVVNPKYELLGATTEVHLVFSVSGGTGCGTFLNAAYMIKEVCPGCKLCGYAVLPDIFETAYGLGANMAKVKPNAFGALQDLDYLMHLDPTMKPVNVEYFTKEYQYQSSPFNAVYLVDNKNANGDVYAKPDDIAEMISLALVSSTGELSVATASVSDNVEKIIQNGNMNIRNKLAWAAGFGISEIVYDSKTLSDTFVDKTVSRIATRLLIPLGDANIEANAWMDSVKIRENNRKDDVTDYIADSNIAPFSVSDATDVSNDAKIYSSVMAVKPADLSAKVDVLKEKVQASFDEFITKKMNADGGVGTALSIIDELGLQIDLCLGEMRNEIAEKNLMKPQLQSEKEGAIKDLEHFMNQWIKPGAQKRQKIDAVQEAVTNELANEIEIVRREYAVSFYTWFQQVMSDKKKDVETVAELLRSVKAKADTNVSRRQNLIGADVRLFTIDLAQEEIKTITYNDEEIVLANFVNDLKPHSIWDFKDMTDSQIEKHVREYAKSLPSVHSFSSKSVEEALREILKDSPEKFDDIINNAVIKSKPLFTTDFIGFVPDNQPEDYMYVGVPDKSTSVLVEDNRLDTYLTGFNRYDVSSLGSRDRIIIYHQIGNVPLFAVQPIPGYAHKYKNEPACCHWDISMKRRMDSEKYTIMPDEEEDLSLELWVKGFIFGLIKKNPQDSKYYFQSEALGDPLDQNWVCLGSAYRDVAYEAFRTHQDVLKEEYESIFEYRVKTEGRNQVEKEINAARDNYMEVSQIGIDRNTLRKKGYEGTADLFRNELNYVKTMTL